MKYLILQIMKKKMNKIYLLINLKKLNIMKKKKTDQNILIKIFFVWKNQ